jgi:hypothetical protein
MRFGTWNASSLFGECSLTAVARDLATFVLVGVQEVRWDKGGTEPADDYAFYCGSGNENHELGTGFLVHKRIISAVTRVVSVSDRISPIILRRSAHWRDAIDDTVSDTTLDAILCTEAAKQVHTGTTETQQRHLSASYHSRRRECWSFTISVALHRASGT